MKNRMIATCFVCVFIVSITVHPSFADEQTDARIRELEKEKARLTARLDEIEAELVRLGKVFAVEKHGLHLRIVSVERDENDVKVTAAIKIDGSADEIVYYTWRIVASSPGTRLTDQFGKEYETQEATFGSLRSFVPDMIGCRLAAGVPTQVTASYKDVDPNAKTASLIEFFFNARGKKISLKVYDVPLDYRGDYKRVSKD